jgi:flagellar protein FlaG
MPIDNIAKLVMTQARSTTAKTASPASNAPAMPRQELPGSGKSMPPASDSSEIMQAVSRLNGYVQSVRRDLQFRVDKSSDRVIVSVVDSESGEIIRQIPSEEVLAVASGLERAQGLIFNERA